MLKFSKPGIVIIGDMQKAYKNYYDLFYKFHPGKITELYGIRHSVMSNLRLNANKISSREVLVLTKFTHVLDILISITEIRMCIDQLD